MLEFDPSFLFYIKENFESFKEGFKWFIKSTEMMWVVILLQSFFSKFRYSNLEKQFTEKQKAFQIEEESVERKIESYAREIRSILWRCIDVLHDNVTKSSSKTIQIHKGYDTMTKGLNEYRRDYHDAYSKAISLFIENVYNLITEEVESNNTYDVRFNNIKEIARCERNNIIDETHKNAGYSSELIEIENEYFSENIFYEMVKKIYDHAERCRVKRISQEKSIAEKYSYDILSIWKYVLVFIRRGKK